MSARSLALPGTCKLLAKITVLMDGLTEGSWRSPDFPLANSPYWRQAITSSSVRLWSCANDDRSASRNGKAFLMVWDKMPAAVAYQLGTLYKGSLGL